MIWRLLWETLLFALPFVLYYLYTRVAKRDEEGKLGHAHPWGWLFVAGLVLAIGGFVWLGLTDVHEGTYVPAREVNGEIVPGHYVPAPNPAPAP
jgi:hypothetical protein